MLRPIKLVLFFQDLAGGGAERALVTIANRLPRERFSTTIVVQKLTARWYPTNPWIEVVSLERRRARSCIRPLAKFLREKRPHILYSALPHLNGVAILAKLVSRESCRVVVSIHNNPEADRANTNLRFLPNRAIAFLYRRAHAVVAVSQGLATALEEIGIPSHKLVVLPNPIEVRAIQEKSNEPFPALHAGEPSQEPMIVMLGRLAPQKDHDTFLRAFEQICAKRPARAIVIGEGSERPRLIEVAKKLGISGRVSFPGFLDNPYAVIRRAACFVLASRWEGFGMVLLEAMAAGAPVVSTDCPFGPAELIEDGKNGLLVPVGDSQEMAKAVERVMDDPEFAKQLRVNGAATAESYDADHVVAAYSSYLTEWGNLFANPSSH